MDAWVVALVAAVVLGAGWFARRRLLSTRRRQASADRDLEALRAELTSARDDRDRLGAVLAAMEEGVILLDGSGRIVFRNVASLRMVRGLPSAGGPAPPSLRSLAAGIPEDGEAGGPVVVEGPSGQVLEVRAAPLGTGTVVVLRDVTEARRVEAMRRDFVADASHELKTPAASIQAAAETLERAVEEDPEAAAAFAGRLRRDATRLARMVSDLLDLSRVESEPTGSEVVALDRVVNEEVERIRDEAREAGIDVATDVRAASVRGSGRDLALLVANLLDNAVRYSPDGGRVAVSVMPADGRAVLEVADSGVGIPSRDLPRVFERFYRVDRARARDTGGTGLGLSIARHVAERHGGRIEARSELGRGSTFRVELPLLT